MKLLNSLIAFTTTWVSLEGLAMATKAGIELPKAVEILRTAGASNFYIDRQVETIDVRNRPTQFAPGAGGQGRRSHRGVRCHAGDADAGGGAVSDVLDAAVAQGFGGADWSELVTFAEQQADVALGWDRRGGERRVPGRGAWSGGGSPSARWLSRCRGPRRPPAWPTLRRRDAGVDRHVHDASRRSPA